VQATLDAEADRAGLAGGMDFTDSDVIGKRIHGNEW
jgi:hypothetical protein